MNDSLWTTLRFSTFNDVQSLTLTLILALRRSQSESSRADLCSSKSSSKASDSTPSLLSTTWRPSALRSTRTYSPSSPCRLPRSAPRLVSPLAALADPELISASSCYQSRVSKSSPTLSRKSGSSPCSESGSQSSALGWRR